MERFDATLFTGKKEFEENITFAGCQAWVQENRFRFSVLVTGFLGNQQH